MSIEKDFIDPQEFLEDLMMPESARYLPVIYHEEAERLNSPLRALLLTIDENFNKVERIIDHIEHYFDVANTPDGTDNTPDFLTWLSSWVAMDLDPDWDSWKKRFAVEVAVTLHRYRGTKLGLSYMLELYFNIEVQINEWQWPPAMQIGVRNTIGRDTWLVDMPNKNFCFILTWTPKNEELMDEGYKHRVRKIRAMIDREKPAHTLCYFNIRRSMGKKIK